MCRGSGLLPCEGAGCCCEAGTAARAFRNDARAYALHSLSSPPPPPPPPPPPSSPGQALSRTSDKPSAQNITRFHGGGKRRKEKPVSALPGWLHSAASALGAPSRGRAAGSHGGRRPPDPRSYQRCDCLPALSTAFNNNLLINLGRNGGVILS